MQKEKFIKLYEQRGYDSTGIEQALEILKGLNKYCATKQETIDKASISTIKDYIQHLIDTKQNTRENLLALARYYYMIDAKETYVYFTALFGSSGVIKQICNRIKSHKVTDSSIFDDYPEHVLGLDTDKMPDYTSKFMADLSENVPIEDHPKVLSGNNHQIPATAMLKEKEYYQQASSLDQYLKERHQRKVTELTEHMNNNKIWFEQVITQPVVDYVANNQEILSAVRNEQYLYVTKIPFDTESFLKASNQQEKLYYACHCPFVREGIREGTLDVHHNWCYCSAGFAKFPFEVILEEPLKVEILETPLKGDLQCRFRIKLPESIVDKL